MRQQWNRLQYIILRCNNQLSIPTTIEHDSIERFNTRAGEQSYHKPQHWWWRRRRWWDIDCNINLHWHLLHRHRCFWSPWNTTREKREERLPLLLYKVNSRATCDDVIIMSISTDCSGDGLLFYAESSLMMKLKAGRTNRLFVVHTVRKWQSTSTMS